jgi:hypothetical protein
MVTRNNRSRKARRQEAITFVIDQLGNDAVTTHEVWFYGHHLIEKGVTWPIHTKRAFTSISRIDDLGQLLRGHPQIKFVDDVESYSREAGRIRRFRTKIWMRMP